MALLTDWSNNRFGVPAPDSYTRIIEISVQRRITLRTPPTPQDPSPGVLATHAIVFRTETFLTEAIAKDPNGSPIEQHGYTFFPTWEDTDVMKQCYQWLKDNIDQFKDARDA